MKTILSLEIQRQPDVWPGLPPANLHAYEIDGTTMAVLVSTETAMHPIRGRRLAAWGVGVGAWRGPPAPPQIIVQKKDRTKFRRYSPAQRIYQDIKMFLYELVCVDHLPAAS